LRWLALATKDRQAYRQLGADYLGCRTGSWSFLAITRRMKVQAQSGDTRTRLGAW